MHNTAVKWRIPPPNSSSFSKCPPFCGMVIFMTFVCALQTATLLSRNFISISMFTAVEKQSVSPSSLKALVSAYCIFSLDAVRQISSCGMQRSFGSDDRKSVHTAVNSIILVHFFRDFKLFVRHHVKNPAPAISTDFLADK